MLDRRYTGSKVLCRIILILMFIATFLFVSINLIYLVFLPLALTLLSWQRHRYYDWLFIVYYFIYAVSLARIQLRSATLSNIKKLKPSPQI